MAAPNNGAPNRDNQPSRHSPVAPLAPLEFLQNQRRGSITDPSLHATPGPRQNINAQFFRQDKTILAEPRPTSPYVFGSATHAADSPGLRKLLRSPSPGHPHENPTSSTSRIRSDSFRGPGTQKNGDGDPMNVDNDGQQTQAHRVRHMSHEPQAQFDYNMRRHSIAVGQDPHTRSPSHLAAPHGIKRKMSADPAGFPTVGEEIDAQLAGPGLSSGMEMDTEAPAPKRRGSAIDTQRIAQLSLNDRRDSLGDSRGPQWWMNDRRDSSSSMFSSVSSVGGYSSGFSGGDSPHGRPPPGIATFAWPSHPPDQPGIHNEADPNMPVPPRTFDPSAPIGMMPPINFPPDRRMSVPDALNPAPVGPKRVLRSRSRPPSRQKQSPDANNSGPSSGQDDPVSAPSPTGSGKHSKDSSTTPYSRSPELRVSHKLAERKRRKEMKELFDELRDHLPADRGMKASKWEILSKAIDFVVQLKQGHQDMAREIDMLRHELETVRPGAYPPGLPPPPPPHAPYPQSQAGPFPTPPTGAVQQQPPLSRPGSSQNVYPPAPGGPTGQNGNLHRTDGPPT
ncbi:hypothetical protein B0H17DRAFT_1048551 [Mycena rosella]|uniref:BHLH domain-containing protein n=1 Tax=Mycena rosella TaxID=1033263 RepID=A0AAD7GPX7_MYCRO|nr:hypothetical protein B0H17DRAFT_1048551 [Mycena rosella]